MLNNNHTSTPTVIIGFDPGLGTTGYGVITAAGSKFKVLAYGVLSTSPRSELPARLADLQQQTRALLKLWTPTKVGIEKLMVGKNIMTVMGVAQARGVLMAECAADGLLIIELTPMQIKLNVTGYGHAPKGQVNRLLKVQLGITKPITPDDASDALAIAVAVSGYR